MQRSIRMTGVAGELAPRRTLAASGRISRALRRALREPFLQFFVLGALLFVLSEYLEQRASVPRIEISRADVEGIKNNYRLQYGASPTAEQLATLMQQHITEEVFYHEALKLKLEQNDEIVRRRLVQKFEFLQQDLSISRDPTEDELRVFYRAHAKNYQVPERLSFSHVFFSIDRGDGAARIRAQRALAALDQARLTRAADLGDSFPGEVDYAAVTPTQVRRAFGSSPLSEQLFQLPPGAWSGPLRSGLGWHLVYVAAHQPAAPIPFADAHEAVRRDYLQDQRERRNAQALDQRKKHYRIAFE